ncbi:MAG: Do family serine endopeptidase [Pseudomonadota bacterium]
MTLKIQALIGRAGGWFALLAVLLVWTAPGARAQGPVSVADLAERLSGAVVNISTTQRVRQTSSRDGNRTPQPPNLPENSPFRDFFKDFFDNQQPGQRRQQPRRRRPASSLGSGFVIDPEGIVITNNHVIAEAAEITVNFADGKKLKAKLIGKDPKTDIAVLKVEPEAPLQAVEFGDSKALRVGDWVMAIGNPFGLGGTVTLGIVSARNRDINAGPYDDFIQTDAAINRGNSGGPLFDMSGKVVGINTAIISPSGGSIGIGFSIPATTATGVIDQLRKFGETRRGKLGVRIQHVTDELAESIPGLGRPRGAMVNDVTDGSPAAAGGILKGDVILEFDGEPVPQMRELPRMVARTPVGKEVEVVVLRKGEEMTLMVTVGRLEETKKASLTSPSVEKKEVAAVETALGLKLLPISDELRTKFKLTEKVEAGVLVSEVDPDSAAAEKNIRAGNVILEVGQEKVSTPSDVVNRVKALEKEGRKSVLMLVSNQNGDLRFLAIRLKKKDG